MNNLKKEYPDQFGKIYDMVLHWTITDYCNFSCYGCIGNAKKAGKDYVPEKIDVSALKKTLDNLNKTIKIIITGGEPFLIENIVEVISEITSKNYISLITNLSNPKVKEFAEKIDPERVVWLKASAHIMQLEKYNLLDTYLNHYNLLQEKGFRIFTEEIGYPVMAEKVEKYKKIFLDRGIELNYQAYRGLWQGKTYPDAYTDEENKIFNFSVSGAATSAIHHRKGFTCNAGYNAIVAHSDGSINPCYSLFNSMGNLFQNFKLNATLMKCPLADCSCPIAVYDPILYQKAIDETKILI